MREAKELAVEGKKEKHFAPKENRKNKKREEAWQQVSAKGLKLSSAKRLFLSLTSCQKGDTSVFVFFFFAFAQFEPQKAVSGKRVCRKETKGKKKCIWFGRNKVGHSFMFLDAIMFRFS